MRASTLGPILQLCILSYVLVVEPVYAWYFPGYAPREYTHGQPIAVKVDKSTSSKTQISLGFYQLPYCRPETITNQVENIGEILEGDLLQNSLFEFNMLQEVECKVTCIKDLSSQEVNRFIDAIENEYILNIWADNLPVGMPRWEQEPKTKRTHDLMSARSNDTFVSSITPLYSTGILVGAVVTNATSRAYVLTNHFSFTVYYHPADDSKSATDTITSIQVPQNYTAGSKVPQDPFHVVGFSAVPKSLSSLINNDSQSQLEKPSDVNVDGTRSAREEVACKSILEEQQMPPYFLTRDVPASVPFSYSVRFTSSDKGWNSRWERYFEAEEGTHPRIHWFALANSVAIVLLLSGVVATILLQTILRDIARYNRLEDTEGEFQQQEETGWKLVHGDVFRRPRYGRWLAACAGTGIQLLGMCILTLVAATLGAVSATRRGSIVQALLFLYAFMGVPGGYVAVRLSTLFEKNSIRRTLGVTYMTAFLFPGVCFTVFLLMNLLLHIKESSGAVSFWTLFKLLLLWFGISVPLVFLGACMGGRKDTVSVPVRTNQIPRQIPPSPSYLHWFLGPAITGILPFCAVFTELFFIFSSVWHHRFYFLFSFVLMALIIVVITSVEISIAFSYCQLCAENYHWWWPAFWASGASAFYVFLYGVFYFYATLHITQFSAIVLYFGYTALIAYAFGLLTGAVGFISSFGFIRVIYAAVKVD